MLDAATLDRAGDEGLAAALRGGVDWLQIRERELDAAGLLERVDRAVDVARRTGRPAQVIVNRRLDVALAAAADGAHLGFDAVPAETARTLLGADACIGISTHSADEVTRAPGAVNYAHLAPVFAPLSKESERPPVGLEVLAEACRSNTPVIAQGGIQAETASQAIAAGAAGVAVTGAISHAEDFERAARELREALDA